MQIRAGTVIASMEGCGIGAAMPREHTDTEDEDD
jgi:hypothetical protein